MQGRRQFVEELLEQIDSMLTIIEQHEEEDFSFGLAREIAEQLHEEVDSLRDE